MERIASLMLVSLHPATSTSKLQSHSKPARHFIVYHRLLLHIHRWNGDTVYTPYPVMLINLINVHNTYCIEITACHRHSMILLFQSRSAVWHIKIHTWVWKYPQYLQAITSPPLNYVCIGVSKPPLQTIESLETSNMYCTHSVHSILYVLALLMHTEILYRYWLYSPVQHLDQRYHKDAWLQ